MTLQEDFLAAVTRGDTAHVEALLGQDAALVDARSEGGVSALLLALYYGQRDVAELLATHGATLSIFEATALGRLDRVQALVNAQPDLVHSYTPDGFQPLGYAAFFGQPAVAHFLLARGADPNAPSRNAMRVMPLHSATASGQVAIARALLDHGADPNAVQQDDFRPIHNAAQNGQREMVELLVQYGADVTLPSRDGRAAPDFAREAGHTEVADLLEQIAQRGQ